MKVGLDLVSFRIDDVFLNVVVHYVFQSSTAAKEFQVLFNNKIEDDYSNLLESLLIFEKTKETKKVSNYEVSLNLPTELEKAFEVSIVDSITTAKYPNIKINREMMQFNNKKIILELEDFSNELLAVKFTKSGPVYMLPQQWLEIDEKTVRGVYNTKWVMNIDNFIRIEENAIVSKYKDGKEIFVPQELIKMDGIVSRFTAYNENYKDTENGQTVPKELLVIGGK